MRKKTIPIVKVLWKNQPEREATWKNEEMMRSDYPHFLLRFATYSLTIPHKDKFDNRGVKCILLRYPLNQKGYRLYSLDSGEIFNSRESVFPFIDCNKTVSTMPKTVFPTFGDEEHDENPTSFTDYVPNDAIPNTPNSPTSDNLEPVPSVPSSTTNTVPLEPVTRSTRQTAKPLWLKDFVDPTAAKTTPHYPLFASTEFNGIPQPHIAFLANVFATPEPSRESFTAALVYVDDMLITRNSPSEIQHLKQALDNKFTIKDLGLAKKYILDLLTDAAAKPNLSPLPTNLKLSLDKGSPLSDPAAYRRSSFHPKDLHIPVKLPITLFCDNMSAQQIAANPCFHDRTKHMDIDYIMTKALNNVQHSFLADKLGVSTAPT
ncbi:retrovirus-related pol polyprotein from transposon TNT 1-94 [Tanacetum coccineum]